MKLVRPRLLKARGLIYRDCAKIKKPGETS